MLAGQKLQENGVEIALFPGLQLIANPHKDYIACDFGGTDFYAPNKVIVKRNSSSTYHGVYFWTVEPVLTKDHGITHLSYLLLHDNDVSDLSVGKVIEQGQEWYQQGGFGTNGATSYAKHIHLCVAIGHTLKTEYVNGHQQLVGSIYPDQIFFTNDTKIVKTSGMNWGEYKAHVIEPVAPTETAITDPITTSKMAKTEEIAETVKVELPIEVKNIATEISIIDTTQQKNDVDSVKNDADNSTVEIAKVEEKVIVKEKVEPIIVKEVIKTSQNDTIAVSKPIVSNMDIPSVNTSSNINSLLRALFSLILNILKWIGKKK